jgi:hypothetical protein
MASSFRPRLPTRREMEEKKRKERKAEIESALKSLAQENEEERNESGDTKVWNPDYTPRTTSSLKRKPLPSSRVTNAPLPSNLPTWQQTLQLQSIREGQGGGSSRYGHGFDPALLLEEEFNEPLEIDERSVEERLEEISKRRKTGGKKKVVKEKKEKPQLTLLNAFDKGGLDKGHLAKLYFQMLSLSKSKPIFGSEMELKDINKLPVEDLRAQIINLFLESPSLEEKMKPIILDLISKKEINFKKKKSSMEQEKKVTQACQLQASELYKQIIYPAAMKLYYTEHKSFQLPVMVQKYKLVEEEDDDDKSLKPFYERDGPPFEEVHSFVFPAVPTPSVMKISIGDLVKPNLNAPNTFLKENSALRTTNPVAELKSTAYILKETPKLVCEVKFSADFETAETSGKIPLPFYYSGKLNVSFEQLLASFKKSLL